MVRPGILLLAACAAQVCGAQPEQPQPQTAGAPEFYRLRPGDIVRVAVFEEPDLSVEQKVDPEGVVILPLLGRTELGGLTLREAEATIESDYREGEFLISPQVTVSVAQYAERVFYIFGEVQVPGAKPFPPGRQSLDILEAITMAGDLTPYAKRNEVILRRPSKESNTEQRITIDLDKVMRGNQKTGTPSIEVLPDDLIYVPERMF